jgi:hypothetical protein
MNAKVCINVSLGLAAGTETAESDISPPDPATFLALMTSN